MSDTSTVYRLRRRSSGGYLAGSALSPATPAARAARADSRSTHPRAGRLARYPGGRLAGDEPVVGLASSSVPTIGLVRPSRDNATTGRAMAYLI